MQVTLAGTLLRIQWQPLPADVEAQIVDRLQGIDSAIAGNMPRTYYVHMAYLDQVMEQFPRASFSADVIAQYPPKPPLGRMEPVQSALWDVEAIGAKAARLDGIVGRNKFNRRKAK
jgi:hypothetical protein